MCKHNMLYSRYQLTYLFCVFDDQVTAVGC